MLRRHVLGISLVVLCWTTPFFSLFGQTPSGSTGGAPPSAVAKPDTSGEAVVFLRMHDLVRFENDGTGLRETTAVIRVQSQAGIQQLGQLIFGYSSGTEDLRVDYVRVRKSNGQVMETPASTAQDLAPEILQEAPMYSDYRQRHISVVGLSIGDVLEYHTITQVKPLAQGEFWYQTSFMKHSAAVEQSLEIDVPKSRELKLKSPEYKFETEDTGDRRVYRWSVRDVAPDRKHESMEDEEYDQGPDVQLSTFTGWPQVAHWYAKLQGERVVVDEIVRKKAEDLTRGATTPTEKARRLYDFVAPNIRYVSLSFGVGRLQPHPAPEILQNGYGDCKDKHTLLAALLRAEGIPSYPVLINSSRKLDLDVPSPAQFDHVITAVPFGKGGELTWLDATAEIAPYGLIMYQLRNKDAVIASEEAIGGIHKTPADSPVKNHFVMKLDGKFTETGALDSGIDVTAQGDSDLPLRALLRSEPQAEWERVLKLLSLGWGFDGDVSDIHVEGVNDTTQPFHLVYHYHKDNYFRVPSAAVNFAVLPPVQRRRLRAAGKKKGLEPLDVGPSGEVITRAHMQFAPNYTVHLPSNVSMTRDYGEYASSYTLSKNTLDAERHMVLKVSELPASRRSDYESFQSATGSSVEQGLWCNITPASAAAVASASKVAGTPEELRKAGISALERKDFAGAADLLKRSAEQDPKQKDAWEDLGRAYAGLNQHEEAASAFRKQIEIDPYHARANADLAVELQQQGKLEEAVVAYKKQLEIAPSDKTGHKNLGLLLAQMKRDVEARSELETAASLPPEDPQVTIALAQVYSRTGQAERGEALMKGVLGGGSGLSSEGDIFSPALSDSADPNEAIHDARQTLSDVGEQFESGEYDRLGAPAFSSMNLVALAWARIGWAKSKQGQALESIQYLNSAWLLSQSGTVGNRLAKAFEQEAQKDKARHMFALAAAAGGPDAASSREQVSRLASNPDAAAKEISQAVEELVKSRTSKLAGVTSSAGSARCALVFDSSTKPERAEFVDGDAALRGVCEKLKDREFPVKFPDVSSIKIIRRASVTCDGAGCTALLMPLDRL